MLFKSGAKGLAGGSERMIVGFGKVLDAGYMQALGGLMFHAEAPYLQFESPGFRMLPCRSRNSRQRTIAAIRKPTARSSDYLTLRLCAKVRIATTERREVTKNGEVNQSLSGLGLTVQFGLLQDPV